MATTKRHERVAGIIAEIAVAHMNKRMPVLTDEELDLLQAHLDAVADALGADLMGRFDGYHGECVKRLMEVAKASARYVASHRLQAVRLQGAEDKSEYVDAAKALDEALVELHGKCECTCAEVSGIKLGMGAHFIGCPAETCHAPRAGRARLEAP